MDESQLLGALARDLDAAFEQLVRRHGDRVYSIALRMLGKPADAEDVAQDTFVRAYRALGGWEPARIRELRLGPWLATICLNLVRNRSRRPRAEVAALAFVDDVDHPSGSGRDTPHEHLALRLTAEAWAARLLRIPERYRAPIVLRHVDGLAYDEIADALDRPEGTVKAQVHRGLALLRALLEAEVSLERAAPGQALPGDPEPELAAPTSTHSTATRRPQEIFR